MHLNLALYNLIIFRMKGAKDTMKRSWKILLVVVSISMVAMMSAGCSKKAGKGNSLQIAGSSSVQPLSEELAAEFMGKHPDIKINVAGGGSGAGIKAAQNGTADIGASSRELKPEEKTVKEIVIAKDGIAVIVNADNTVESLTLEQLQQVFTGEITNWNKLGGKDARISVIVREEGSGTRGAFEEIVMGKDKSITDKALVQNSTGAIRTAVAGDSNAVGFISIGALSKEVKPLKIDGAAANMDNVLSGTYKISRPFVYMTKEEPTGLGKEFIDFVLSPAGQKIVGKAFIPVK